MKQIWKGKKILRIKKEYPYYGTGCRHLHKVLIKDLFGWSVSIWISHPDSCLGELTDWAKKHLMSIFPGCSFIDNRNVVYGGRRYYVEDTKWLFNPKYDLKATTNPQVFFDQKHSRYIGYSHRAAAGFGLGDMLFEEEVKNKSIYYHNKKYRRKYLWHLLKYHITNDVQMFEDMCEDDIIGHGIMNIVPFREKGNKRIENMAEAFKAAANFAEYVS